MAWGCKPTDNWGAPLCSPTTPFLHAIQEALVWALDLFMLAHVGSCWPPFFWWLLGIPEFVMGLKIDCLQQQSHNRAPWTILDWQVTKHTWIFGFQFSKLRMNSEKWLVLVSHVVSTDHIRDEMFSQWFPCIYGIDGWTNQKTSPIHCEVPRGTSNALETLPSQWIFFLDPATLLRPGT